jgi:hypothetical protein
MNKKYKPFISGIALGLIIILSFSFTNIFIAPLIVAAAIFIFNKKEWI